MIKRNINDINQNYNKVISSHFMNEKYIKNNLKKNNNKHSFNDIKRNKMNNGKIISFLFNENGYNYNQKMNRIKLEVESGIYNGKNNMNKIMKSNLINLKANNLIIFLLLVFVIILKECKLTMYAVHSSIITIKINETGWQNIFYGESQCIEDRPKFDLPDEVFINDEKLENIEYQYNFETTDNIIQLIWNNPGENWGCLFKNCINIIEIDFSQFDFSKLIQANSMFHNCKSLTSLNINDFGKVKLKDAGSIFRGMTSLISINLSNFDMTEVTDIGGMFWDCASLTTLDLSNFQINNNVETKYLFSNCPNLEYINLKNSNFLPNTELPFISAKNNIVFCSEDSRITSRVSEYECSSIDCSDNWRQNQKKINLENNQCVNDCSETNNNKYNYKNECCENCPIGTYNDSFKCKECHPDCKICEKAADIDSTYCLSCSDLDKYLNFGNCYNKDNILINNIDYFDNTLKDIINSYIPENGNYFAIKRPDETIYHITNTQNELELLNNKGNNKNNISIIDLGECETILRKIYQINETDSLIIIKNEKISNKPSEKNINFDVYEPYSKTKLNLSLCDDSPINVYIPTELNKDRRQLYEKMKELGYDMFNINDSFYQDICIPFDSSNGTDILLIDRINYIYNNDDTQCQSNCQFSHYSIESKYLQCSCSTNVNINNNDSKKDKFSSKKLYESFYDVLRYSNYNIIKCFNIVTNIKEIRYNIGSIITIICFICYLICLFIYIFRRTNTLKLKLKQELKFEKIELNFKFKHIINNLLFPPIKKKSNSRLILKNSVKGKNPIIFNKIEISSKKDIYNKFKINSNSSSKNNIFKNNIINKSIKKKLHYNNKKLEKNILKEYSDYELNELQYEKALKLDKRTLFQIYLAALKREHLIIFTFCSCNDYNLLSVKITRFIFLIIDDMALNTFFFSDDSMHKLFLNYGKYNFIQQIPEITYSTIITLIIEIFLCYLSLTDKYFYLLKSSLVKGDKKLLEI